ncbi:MAG: DUF2271 domain-containing protein [Clostridiales bacterium]|nr:DUF2271 domain-containing protein [Clostridiales bacterium]
MKKKLILVTLAAILLLSSATIVKIKNPFNFGIRPLIIADEQKQTGRRFEISFSCDNLLLVASNQYAFWIEDMDGNYIDTLYVTRYTGGEGYRRRPQSIQQWVSAARPGDMRSSEIDAITGATPKPGNYSVYWDFTDGKGNAASDTQYRYFIEGTMYMGDNVLYSGVFTTGEEVWEEYPVPEYSVPNSEYKAMLSNIRVAYYPN